MTNQYATTYNAVLCMLLQQAQKLSSANGAALEVKEGNHLHYLSVTGVLEHLLDYKVPIDGTFSGACLLQKNPQSCTNIKTNPMASISRLTFANLDINSMVVIPIFDREGDVKAVLKLTSENEDFFCTECAEQMESWLEPLTKSISAAMTDAQKHANRSQQTYDGLESIRLKKIQDNVFNKENSDENFIIFDALSKIINKGVFVTDLHGKCVYTNETYQTIRDLTEDETLGIGWTKNIHLDDLKFIDEVWSDTVNLQTTLSLQYRMYDKSGNLKKCKATSVPLLNNNKIFGHLGILEEISSK